MKLTKDEKSVFIALGIILFLASLFLYLKDEPNNSNIISSHQKKRFSLIEYSRFLKEKRKININEADLYQLNRIPGIGVVLASRIIEYRKNHGDIISREELLKVKGIGNKKLKKILPFIKFNT